MAIRVEIDDMDSTMPYAIWTEPDAGARYIGRCIGVGRTLDEAKDSARDELLGDMQEIDALAEPENDPREKGDEDGREYADPRDEKADRL